MILKSDGWTKTGDNHDFWKKQEALSSESVESIEDFMRSSSMPKNWWDVSESEFGEKFQPVLGNFLYQQDSVVPLSQRESFYQLLAEKTGLCFALNLWASDAGCTLCDQWNTLNPFEFFYFNRNVVLVVPENFFEKQWELAEQEIVASLATRGEPYYFEEMHRLAYMPFDQFEEKLRLLSKEQKQELELTVSESLIHSNFSFGSDGAEGFWENMKPEKPKTKTFIAAFRNGEVRYEKSGWD